MTCLLASSYIILVGLFGTMACNDNTKDTGTTDTAAIEDIGIPSLDSVADASVDMPASLDEEDPPEVVGADTLPEQIAFADTAVADTAVADTAAADTAVVDTVVVDTAIADTAVADTSAEVVPPPPGFFADHAASAAFDATRPANPRVPVCGVPIKPSSTVTTTRSGPLCPPAFPG